jgi:hypothetical protein
MKKLVSLIALSLIGCPSTKKPTPNPPPQPDAGGSGGNSSIISSTSETNTAGTTNIITVGGSSMGGNVSGGTSSCSPIEPLVPQPATERRTREIKKPHTVGKRHHRKPGRAKRTIRETEELCPVLHNVNNTIPLDQDKPQPTGSCTGNAGVTSISTQNFQGDQRHNQTDARLAYQGGTCEDNHCTIPCTCESCPAAFCPTTNANDTGSTGSSVMAWMTAVKWISGYTTADTIEDLKACLANGSNPVIGIDWYSGFDNISTTSVLTIGGYIRGGHELDLIGWDGTNFIGINSWGLWGFCRQSQINVDTPSIGTGCGYFKISPNTLQRAKFDGDCPKLN